MIELTKLANIFEEGLNDVYKNPEIQFKIWAEAGEHAKAIRDGNTVTYFINGNLRTNSSANDANALVMGVNGLALEFVIPVTRPRTYAGQPSQELATVQEGQLAFVTEVIDAINGYFQTAQSLLITDKSGVEFSVSFQAGTCVTGNIDLAAKLGNYVGVSVYIEVYFIEGGVSSKLVKVFIDDSPVPVKAVRHGRSPMLERDVYAGTLISKSVATSTAFSIDVEFPANKDAATKACLDYLLKGDPNVAHFLDVKFGDVQERLYLMTLNTVQTAAQGISIPGITASFIEVTDNVLALNVPDGFQVGKFKFATSEAESLTFTPSEDCLAYVAGQALKLTGGNAYTLAIESSAMQYDYDNGVYEVYLITNKTVSISAASATYENVLTGV